MMDFISGFRGARVLPASITTGAFSCLDFVDHWVTAEKISLRDQRRCFFTDEPIASTGFNPNCVRHFSAERGAMPSRRAAAFVEIRRGVDLFIVYLICKLF